MAYIPRHVKQGDGSKCQWTNCWAAVGAWLVDGATRGKKKPTPMEFRKAARALRGCRTGGYGDLVAGLAHYGIKSRVLNDVPLADAKKRLRNTNGRKLYAMASDWSVWPDQSKCLGDYDGYHMAGMVPGDKRLKAKAVTRTEDPLCTRLKWVRTSAVLKAGVNYNVQHGGKKRTLDLLVVSIPKRNQG